MKLVSIQKCDNGWVIKGKTDSNTWIHIVYMNWESLIRDLHTWMKLT